MTTKTNIVKKSDAHRCNIVYVAFGGRAVGLTRLLKKGFRHCFIIMSDGTNWVLIDPIIGFTDMIFVKKENLFNFIDKKGYTLVRAKLTIQNKRPFHLRPMTCVEIVKSLLCISNPFIFTPYQLYKYLKKKEVNTQFDFIIEDTGIYKTENGEKAFVVNKQNDICWGYLENEPDIKYTWTKIGKALYARKGHTEHNIVSKWED